MSKFTDLCDAYKNSRLKYFTYRDECYGFAAELIKNYKKFLDIPENQFKFIPTHEKPDEKATYSLFGAMHLHDDTFWHLGVRITLYEAPNTYPHQPVLIVFKIRKIQDKTFLVKISDEDKGHEIEAGDDANYEDFFEFLQDKIRKNFEEGLQRFLEKTSIIRTIGFCPGYNEQKGDR